MAFITRAACQELELKNGDKATLSIKAIAVHLVPRS
jgi:molybdopterin-binding protein